MSEVEKQKQWRFAPSSFVLIIALAIIVGYAAGTRNDQILATVGPTLGIKVETGTLDFRQVQDTFRQLRANFDGALDDKALVEGASRGLVAAAGDAHTQYLSSKEAQEFRDSLSGTIGGGIGAEIGIRDSHPTIVSVIKDAPAQKEGLRAGDVIVTVNEEAVKEQTVDQIVAKIRGEVGTTVKLAVGRDGQVKNMTLTREKITSPSVTSKVDGDMGILTIARFDERTVELAQAAAQEFRKQNVKKVILDLRDNGGGYLSAAPGVAGLWLKDKLVASERHGDKVLDEQRTGSGDPVLAGLPTVVLINGGTASAAEIVAAALKDHDAVYMVGQKTYGKGTVQTMVDLDGGALLKVTVQRWYTPKGQNIDKKGLNPDQQVELKRDDVNANKDPQLDAARQYLSK